MSHSTRIVQVRTKILKENDSLARGLRRRFEEARVYVVSLVSSPGAGKTMFLESTMRRLRERFRVAALVGDLATENDARRLSRSGVPVAQIITGTVCHLEAAMIAASLEQSRWNLDDFDMLFIENVGNLVCPATFDLGESLRLVLFSVTEGEDKPLKYPTIFQTADVALLTKIDLAAVVEADLASSRANVQSVRPGMPLLEVSAKSGDGMDEWLSWLESRVAAWRRDLVN
jgi:hydrogenase nickel incorporation protein HypB